MIARDLGSPETVLASAAVTQSNELFMVLPVTAGKRYRFQFIKRLTWPRRIKYAMAMYLTSNPQ